MIKQITQEDIDKLNKKKVWNEFINSGGKFTANVYFLLDLIPTNQRIGLVKELHVYQNLPTQGDENEN